MTEWTPQLITAIADLNARLARIEADVIAEAKAMNARLRARIADPHDWLYDYELELHVSCWLREDDPLFHEDRDNVLAVHSTSLKFNETDPCRMQRVWYDNGENYNEAQDFPDHPLSHQHHCRLLYEISRQLPDWEDLARIGTVWVDLQIYDQHRYDPEFTVSSSAHRVVSGSRKLLAEIARRNQRSHELREYGVPEVGIFYVVDGQVLTMTEPWPLASEWDGYRALKSTHGSCHNGSRSAWTGTCTAPRSSRRSCRSSTCPRTESRPASITTIPANGAKGSGPMDDITLTQLFALMEAHLAQQDAHLARQDAELRIITEAMQEQSVLMVKTGEMLATTAQQVAAIHVEASRGFAAVNAALEALAHRLEGLGEG
jgi:hypothetical protein